MFEALYSGADPEDRTAEPKSDILKIMAIEKGAFVFEPRSRSPRLEAQQGHFMIGLNPTFPLLYHLGFSGCDVAPLPVGNGRPGENRKLPIPSWPEPDDHKNLAEFRESFSVHRCNYVWRIRLSKGLCQQLRHKILDSMNVRQSNLFPDLVGLAESVGIFSSPQQYWDTIVKTEEL